MPNYRRSKTKGGTYFFTVVAYRRQRILTLPESRKFLRRAITEIKTRYPFEGVAWVLLPDHLHTIWTLPDGDSQFSKRWGLIKANFSKQAKGLFHRETWMNDSKIRHRETTIWQRRFWEHQIRDEADFAKHVDYIHYNPVKHGYVTRVRDWPYSTFHRFVQSDVYRNGWAGTKEEFEDSGYGE